MLKSVKTIVIVTTLLSISLITSCHQARQPKSINQQPNKEKIALNRSVNVSANDMQFTIVCKTAQIRPLQSDNYLLVMQGITPYVGYYTRRPNRNSGLAATSNFIKAWSVGDNSFQANNPNGVLIAGKIDGNNNINGKIKTLILSNPHYQPSRRRMTFVVRPVDNKNQFIIQNPNYQDVILVIN